MKLIGIKLNILIEQYFNNKELLCLTNYINKYTI